MRFNVSEKQSANLLPEGEYEFEITSATEKAGGNGNDLMVMKFRASSNGTSKIITDYIVANDIQKIKRIAQSIGLLELFETGEIQAELFVGRKGRVKLIVEKSSHHNYPDRNIVACYLTGNPRAKSVPHAEGKVIRKARKITGREAA